MGLFSLQLLPTKNWIAYSQMVKRLVNVCISLYTLIVLRCIETGGLMQKR